MIPRAYITEWRSHAPWIQDAWVEQDLVISRAQFEANLDGKRSDINFRTDISPLLRPGIDWNFDLAMDLVLKNLVANLSGDPWKSGNK